MYPLVYFVFLFPQSVLSQCPSSSKPSLADCSPSLWAGVGAGLVLGAVLGWLGSRHFPFPVKNASEISQPLVSSTEPLLPPQTPSTNTVPPTSTVLPPGPSQQLNNISSMTVPNSPSVGGEKNVFLEGISIPPMSKMEKDLVSVVRPQVPQIDLTLSGVKPFVPKESAVPHLLHLHHSLQGNYLPLPGALR
eukprot:PhF_6_TR12930/c0_g1_i2/m.20401